MAKNDVEQRYCGETSAFMTSAEFSALLQRNESTSLDWKAAFPKGLDSASNPHWESARSTLLRDLVAIANSLVGESGFLVYGVKDLGATRKVLGVTNNLDDATIQQWSENHFDPPVRFEFAAVSVEDKVVGVFEVFSDPGRPHVVTRGLGNLIFEGQVWFRRGTKNTIALRPELGRLFTKPAPLRVDVDGPHVRAVADHYSKLGFSTSLVRYLEKDSKNSEGRSAALDPATGSEIWVGGSHDRPELIMMKRATRT